MPAAALASVSLVGIANCGDPQPKPREALPVTAATCEGQPAAAVLRPLSPRFTYGPGTVRPGPAVRWDGRGVAIGRPVVVSVVKTERAGIGINIGTPRTQHPGRTRRAGFVIVQATSDPRAAMRRVLAAADSVGVSETYDYKTGGTRWYVVDFQRGFAEMAAIGCHVVQVGGANTYDASDITDCLSRRRESLSAPRRRRNPLIAQVGSGRIAVCVRGSSSTR